MVDPLRSNTLKGTPIYTIKTVVQVTGITPATLRAWERRYGVLSPSRSGGGYRLYSERDIATLLWLKGQVDAGVAISRAIALLEMRHQGGEEPEVAIRIDLGSTSSVALPGSAVRDKDALAEKLLQALIAFRAREAEKILSEAFALYPVELVAEEIIGRALSEIGERWHRGEVTVIQEHFATAFLRQRLAALFDAYDELPSGRLAITGSAPSEWHDIGILLVSLTLRRHGWRVIYLGQNVPADHLLKEVVRLHPDLLCMSAATRESALGLQPVAEAIAGLPAPRPRLVVGGRAFNTHPELRSLFPDTYGGATAREFVMALADH